MVRTQIYLPETVHKRLTSMAKQRKLSMGHLIRAFIEGSLSKEQSQYISSQKAMRKLFEMNITGGPKDLSKNLDSYLYD